VLVPRADPEAVEDGENQRGGHRSAAAACGTSTGSASPHRRSRA
jgi:hypothetical protein